MSRFSRNVSAARSGGDFWSDSPSRDVTRSFDPLAHFRSVLQHKWAILAVTTVAAALAVAYSLTATPFYRATQSLLLEATDANVVAVEALVRDEPEDDGYVQTQIEMLRSRDNAERVIDSLDLLAEPLFVNALADKTGIDSARLLSAAEGTEAQGAAVLPTSERKALAVDFLRSGLSVRAVPTTRLLQVGYLSPDPELAATIANEIGLQHILRDAESNRELVGEVSGWLDERLGELKDNLSEAENRLLEFKNENGLVGVDGNVGRIGEQELLQSTAELAEARLRLANVTAQLEQLRLATTTEARLPRLQADPVIGQIRVDIQRVNREAVRLAADYGPLHPLQVELASELDALEAALDEAVGQAVASLENERQLLAGQVASLEARLDASQETIRDVDSKSVELAVLSREVQTNRELYYRFFDRMVETRSTQGLESTNATVIEYATAPLTPAKPDKAFIIVLATFGALACSTLLAVVANAFDDSIRRLGDVEQRLGVRLIGVVPVYRRSRRGALARRLPWLRDADEKAKRMFTEAYKSVRTRLLLGDRDGEPRVVLLTSSVPGEGKSMSAVCLARTLAPTERVLLIDADVRRPSIARALRIDGKSPGLTHVLAGRGDAEHVVQHYPAGGFDVLPSGLSTEHPLELLSSPRMKSMLEELASRYDRILIDSAPVEAVSDALVLSRLVDLVIYVAKSHDTSMPVVASGLEKLRDVDAPLAGLLLTQVDVDKLAVYGADYEFHGYYDYYGYSAPASDDALSLDRDELLGLGRNAQQSASEPRPRAESGVSNSLA